MENIYLQFDGMVYQQIEGIPMGTNCAPIIADFFLYCYTPSAIRPELASRRVEHSLPYSDVTI